MFIVNISLIKINLPLLHEKNQRSVSQQAAVDTVFDSDIVGYKVSKTHVGRMDI
jgi:hypothetical protein